MIKESKNILIIRSEPNKMLDIIIIAFYSIVPFVAIGKIIQDEMNIEGILVTTGMLMVATYLFLLRREVEFDKRRNRLKIFVPVLSARVKIRTILFSKIKSVQTIRSNAVTSEGYTNVAPYRVRVCLDKNTNVTIGIYSDNKVVKEVASTICRFISCDNSEILDWRQKKRSPMVILAVVLMILICATVIGFFLK